MKNIKGGMKLKTLEVIKYLWEHQEKVAQTTNTTRPIYAQFISGVLYYGHTPENFRWVLGLTTEMVNAWEWKIVIEEVDFMTAYKAFKQGKKVESLVSERVLPDNIVNFLPAEIDGKWVILD